MSRPPSRPWIRAAFGIAAVALFIAYAVLHNEAIAVAWGQIRVQYLALLGLPAFGVLWAQGKVFQRSCLEFNIVIGERETLSLAVLTTAGNYVGALRLGAIAKAIYVKRARGLSITDTIAIGMGGTIVATVTAIVCGLMLLLYLPAGRTPMGRVVAGILASTCVALLVALIGPPALLRAIVQRCAPAFARDRLRSLVEAWSIIGRRHLILALFFWQVAIYALAALGFYIGFTLVLDREIGFSAALAFTILTSLASMAALTPGNLGLQEFLIVAVAQSFHMGQGAGVVVAALLRLVQIAVVLALSPIAWRTLRRQMSGRNSTGAQALSTVEADRSLPDKNALTGEDGRH